MKTRIVPSGNSHGIRIPKLLLEQSGLSGEVEISVEDDSLVIRRLKKPREGLAAAFQQFDETAASLSWDKDEWEW